MDITEADLMWAVEQEYLSAEQAQQLWQAWTKYKGLPATEGESTVNDSPPLQFDFANVAFYFGALIVIVAMVFLGTLVWDALGGFGLFTVAVLYAGVLTVVGHWLYFRQKLTVPGGLLITIAVWMTPLAIYGLQQGFGLISLEDPSVYRNLPTWLMSGRFPLAMGTIIVSLLALRFIHFPFLTFPLAFCLWFLSIDIPPLIYGDAVSFITAARITLGFGIVCLAIAYGVDLRWRRSQGDYSFWLYLFGLISFWFSLLATGEDTEWYRLLFCLINLGLMALSILLKRRLFMVFGVMGVFGYISYLAFQVFADSILFPFALSALGLAIIAVGVLYQKHYRSVEAYFDDLLPPYWRNFLPRER
ncbi:MULTISPECIES: hypothetical protein [unclassified Synechocystis]|uniref:hypothetical protein n=1 Tax=unclassified Synechocystis TaxID=2640012 RepID=UPI000415C552|nr:MULTISPECIES: hypothetical protein [unclassified Synechocystis]AIE72943.1 hypothetical protein D082_04140 [Synechocystis sp. PCC 6714]MCT0252580.1 DUF2157 domain-containing protein [Synechocystis sp. CS-94]